MEPPSTRGIPTDQLPDSPPKKTSNENIHTISYSNNESEAGEILKYIKEAYQVPKLIDAKTLIHEDKYLKSLAAKKAPSLLLNTETLSRGGAKFTTQVSNINVAYSKKLKRRTLNLRKGFFSERGQPYASVGEVYTNSATLLKSALMSDIVNKIRYRAKEQFNQERLNTPGNSENYSNQIDLDSPVRQRSRQANRSQVRNNKQIISLITEEFENIENEIFRVGKRNSTEIKSSPHKKKQNLTKSKKKQSSLIQNQETFIKSDSGMKQIRQKLNLTHKMRVNISGATDLLNGLQEMNEEESEINKIDEIQDDNDNDLSPNFDLNRDNLGSNRSSPYNNNRIKTKISKTRTGSEPLWKHNKSRKAMIQEIAENQMTQVKNEKLAVERINDMNHQQEEREQRKKNMSVSQGLNKSAWTKIRSIGKIVNITSLSRSAAEKIERQTIMQQKVDKEVTATLRYLMLINKLLSAMYNMKIKAVKANEHLSDAAVKELLNSDIELDDEGRPRPKILVCKSPLSLKFKKSSLTNCSTPPTSGADRKTRMRLLAKRNLKDVIKISKIMKTQAKIATWEDLLAIDAATGQMSVPSSPIKSDRKQITNDEELITKPKSSQPVWLKTDRHGFDLDKQYLLASDEDVVGSRTKRQHYIAGKDAKFEKIQKMKNEFEKTKASLNKDLHLELEYRKQQQALLIRNKLLSLKLGPIPSVSLEKMRRDAHKMVKDQQLLTPLKTPSWYAKLERQYKQKSSYQDVLLDIGRFQRYPVSGVCDTSKLTSGHDIQNNKHFYLRALDKLCLIMQSLPAYDVLEENCEKAFEFIIKEILGFPDNVYKHWLKLRQLRSGEMESVE